ncbi:hypothetical protein MKEN_00954400 [Mycena kentingensis (nom. inval.)]|nr:hypothetical protein MKEN_00954400 [Mycena kentingensis (nom. inval.)]
MLTKLANPQHHRSAGRQPDDTWWCLCIHKCGGAGGKTVSRQTYKRHAKKDAQLIAANLAAGYGADGEDEGAGEGVGEAGGVEGEAGMDRDVDMDAEEEEPNNLTNRSEEPEDVQMDEQDASPFHDFVRRADDAPSSGGDDASAVDGSPSNSRAHSPFSQIRDPSPDPLHGYTSNDSDGSEPSEPRTSPPPNAHPKLPNDFRIVTKFIQFLRNASLDDEDEVEPDVAYAHRNPPTCPATVTEDEQLSIELYLATKNGSEESYNLSRDAVLRRHPEDEILTFYKVRRLIEDLTGAVWRSEEGSAQIRYRQEFTARILEELERNAGIRTSAFKDFFDGWDYLERAGFSMTEEEVEQRIRDGDMVLMFSMDGAQLYRNKVSDLWMYIWIIFDRAPEIRHKKRYILPGGFIPGPNPPKIPESFIYVGLYFLAACQREKGGLPVWDALDEIVKTIRLHLGVVGADTLGMTDLAGSCGHTGKMLCRTMCPIVGRHKEGLGIHYPCMQLPNDYHIKGCDHPDVDLRELLRKHTPKSAEERYEQNLILLASSRNPTQFRRNRLATGLTKPTLFSGLPSKYTFGIPTLFGLDFMHPILNLMDLLIPLWRGLYRCEKTDNVADWDWAVLGEEVWNAHGAWVAELSKYFPISFDNPPRNPALKINSGYKCYEFLMYLFGLGPALLYGILPGNYYRNLCSLIRGYRLLLQYEISVADVDEAENRLITFAESFEDMYVERRADRIHFVPETSMREWAIECMFGSLGDELQQHSNPYAHFTALGIRRCQVNALTTILPDLVPKKGLPRGAIPLAPGYAMLHRADKCYRRVNEPEEDAIMVYMESVFEDKRMAAEAIRQWDGKVRRFARALLPNGQVARCAWSENQNNFTRSGRMVKVETKGDGAEPTRIDFAEVRFFAELRVLNTTHHIAVGSFFGLPDRYLLDFSYGTYWSAQHSGDDDVRVFAIPSIMSVVMMAPDLQCQHCMEEEDARDRFFLVEKPGLELASRRGRTEFDDGIDSEAED